jgi:deoxyribodipyrimidine photo-lyase
METGPVTHVVGNGWRRPTVAKNTLQIKRISTSILIPNNEILIWIIETMETPTQLLDTKKFELPLTLPESSSIKINNTIPTFIYNYYNLDPVWHKEEEGNRILLIDPELFLRYPVSKKCIDFMLDLSKNIPDIQLYVGNFKTLVETHQIEHVYFKEHPFNFDYKGILEDRDWIAEKVSGYFPSFFAYWKKVEKHLIPK